MIALFSPWLTVSQSPVAGGVLYATGRLVANLSVGWAVAVLAIGALLFLLYRYERRRALRRGQRAAWLIRVVTAIVVLVLFAQPEWIVRTSHRPSVVVLIDESASMATRDAAADQTKTSSNRRSPSANSPRGASRMDIAKRLLTKNGGLLDRLDARYALRLFAVGKTARPLSRADRREELRELRATSTSSRLGEALRRALEMSSAHHPVAAVLLTDGITTQGTTLEEYVSDDAYHGVPLYIVGLGGAQPLPDVEVESVAADALVLAGDSVMVEARIRVTGFQGRTIEARLRDADSAAILATRRIPIKDTAASRLVPFDYLVENPGHRRMVVEVPVQSDEIRADNNRRACHVQVAAGPIRVLLVEDCPRYEFRHIRHVLRRDGGIELTTILAQADAEVVQADAHMEAFFPKSASALFAYDVVLLGDVDPQFLGRPAMRNLVEFVEDGAGGIIFICGPRFMPASFQQSALGILIPVSLRDPALASSPDPTTPSHVTPTALGRHTLFSSINPSATEAARRTHAMLPVYGAFSSAVAKSGALVLARLDNHRHRGPHPCFVMQYAGAGKVLLQAIDETWRWRQDGHDDEGEFVWSRVIRVMARNRLGARSGPARLAVDRQEYRVGDPVRLTLEPGGVTGRLESPTVRLIADQGIDRRLTLRRDPYQADRPVAIVRNLVEGDYEARIDTPLAGKPISSTRFTVRPPPGERQGVAVDLKMLRRTAQQTRGRFYRPAAARRLPSDLPEANRFSLAARVPLWNQWWVMLLLIVLLGAEWLIRRQNGLT